MTHGCYIPANAVKATANQPSKIVTPSLPHMANTGENIFVQPLNWKQGAQPKVRQSQKISNFVICAHMSAGSAQTIIYPQVTQKGQT